MNCVICVGAAFLMAALAGMGQRRGMLFLQVLYANDILSRYMYSASIRYKYSLHPLLIPVLHIRSPLKRSPFPGSTRPSPPKRSPFPGALTAVPLLLTSDRS